MTDMCADGHDEQGEKIYEQPTQHNDRNIDHPILHWIDMPRNHHIGICIECFCPPDCEGL
eukprot:CAMPEP_0202712448 /NCGR_PEP_ID=MMETSP1385-20130828/40200_1 /ASSEMBLY_ACC=CAM_ASM_000861 /TAXON_ID=933848 /ORGANISM="Elphidium margaritaceum" /LENGTH=59 /DNA_ID=CAMNT_0049372487 /DNA_START=30 /DNA_END=206 /DNA_ORIENTATION=-